VLPHALAEAPLQPACCGQGDSGHTDIRTRQRDDAGTGLMGQCKQRARCAYHRDEVVNGSSGRTPRSLSRLVLRAETEAADQSTLCQASRFSGACAHGRGAAPTGRRVAWKIVENFQPWQLFHREHMPTRRDCARIEQRSCIQVYFLGYAFVLIRKGGATALAEAAPYPGRGAEITWGALGEGEGATRHTNPRRHWRRRCAPAALAVAVQGPIRRALILECDQTTQASALDSVQEPRPPCSEVATLPLAASCVNGSRLGIASPWPNSTTVLFFGRIDIWT
jgi:hypothetical protein